MKAPLSFFFFQLQILKHSKLRKLELKMNDFCFSSGSIFFYESESPPTEDV